MEHESQLLALNEFQDSNLVKAQILCPNIQQQTKLRSALVT